MNLTSRIPFFADLDELGLQQAHGFLFYEGHTIFLEYQKEDAILGLFKSDIKEVKIPFSSVSDITFSKKLFSSFIEIFANKMKDFEDVDMAKRGVIKIKIKRKHRKEAEAMLSSIRYQLSEHRLHLLEEEDRKLQIGE